MTEKDTFSDEDITTSSGEEMPTTGDDDSTDSDTGDDDSTDSDTGDDSDDMDADSDDMDA